MSDMQEFCAAYGCPMLGVYGTGGKWFCCCHRSTDGSRNDAITIVLNTHRDLVDQSVSLRRTFAGYAAIKTVEDRLIELTRESGLQASMPASGVIGPTHALDHYSEIDR